MSHDNHVEFSFKGDLSALVQLLGGLAAAPQHSRAPKSIPDVTPGAALYPGTFDFNVPPRAAKEVSSETGHNLDHLSSAVPSAEASGMSLVESLLHKPGFDFDAVPLDHEAWEVFVGVVREWQIGFGAPLDEEGKPTVPQPNRIVLLERIGVGRWPIYVLRWIAHYKCLQEAVLQAMDTKDPDIAENIAMTMVQISHVSFPDITDFFDYSTRWRRNK
jgi:hypothetical protein